MLRPTPLPTCYSVVHLVRDPVRWAISFFDYHSQKPPPEDWIKTGKPVCGQRANRNKYATLAALASPLGIDAPLLAAAEAACAALVAPSKTYLWHLSRDDTEVAEEERLRMMALLHVLDTGSHGDLLRAGTNALELVRRGGDDGDGPTRRVLTLWMEDIVGAPEESFGRLARFLVGLAAPAAPRAPAEAAAVMDAEAEAAATALGARLVAAQERAFSHKAG